MNLRLSNHLTLTRMPLPIRTALVAELQFANPKWLENERMGRWNRGVPKTLKFFHKTGGDGLIVPRGLTRKVILACRQHQEPVVMDDQRRKAPPVDFRFQGALRPFQQIAVDAMLKKDFGTLSAPTGSGKTVMALFMIAQRNQPTLVVVHTKELARQWTARIEAFLGIPEQEVGWIGGGKRRLGAAITVAMVQSLCKCAGDIAPHFGHLVVDECHRAPSRTFTEAVTAFDTQYMLGLSATPFRRDGLSKLIFWHLGDIHHRLEASDLVAGGQILTVEVVWRTTGFVAYADPISEYSKMLSELTHNDTRNRLIVADLAEEVANARRPGVCLVLSDRRLHCQVLQALLRHKHHVDAELLTGDLSGEQRKAVIERVDSGTARVLIATGQLIGEGFDCPRLSTLFLATPVRFSGRMMQYLGRILRPAPGIDQARVYDYVDVLVPPLKKAAQARRGVYAELEQVWSGG